MKYLILLIAIVFTSCEFHPQPEGYINGKPYYTSTNCVKSHTQLKWEYYWGYSILRGKYCWHWGNNEITICDESKTDTIFIK
jgi:hypothetical protein